VKATSVGISLKELGVMCRSV